MPQYLTLKDITALDALADPASVGLVDNIVNYVPELDKIVGRPISGISYPAAILTALTSGGGFRKVGSGGSLSSFSIDEKIFHCFPWDDHFSIDEALLIKRQREAGESPNFIFETFATASAREKAIKLGRQFYEGSTYDALGCPGLIDFLTTQRTQVDSRTGLKIDQVVDARGSTAGQCQTIWFLKSGPQGVHWMFGNGTGIKMNPWIPLYTTPADSTANSPKRQRSWNSNLFGWIGTSMAKYHAVGAIINVDNTNGTDTTNGLWNDAMVAQLWKKFPVTMKPDMAFCTQDSAFTLQKSRTVTNFVSGSDRGFTTGIAPIADYPTSLPTAGNIPLITTDSIVNGNQLVLS
ncbi:MAG: hypothetical protein KGL39_47485 [Patescibacteria group bacterium]|nr:hypothetical protein [Patescibacteria group bacterium]